MDLLIRIIAYMDIMYSQRKHEDKLNNSNYILFDIWLSFFFFAKYNVLILGQIRFGVNPQ